MYLFHVYKHIWVFQSNCANHCFSLFSMEAEMAVSCALASLHAWFRPDYRSKRMAVILWWCGRIIALLSRLYSYSALYVYLVFSGISTLYHYSLLYHYSEVTSTVLISEHFFLSHKHLHKFNCSHHKFKQVRMLLTAIIIGALINSYIYQ